MIWVREAGTWVSILRPRPSPEINHRPKLDDAEQLTKLINVGEEQSIMIDEVAIGYSDESNVLEICNKNHIPIAQMCYIGHLTPAGHCGLCVAELFDESVKGHWMPVLTCVLPPKAGMKIRTRSEMIGKIREIAGQLLLRSHPCDCDFCEKFGRCELRKIYNKTGFGFTRAIEDGKKKKPLIAQLSGRFFLDREKCTQCGLCVHFCREALGEDFLHNVLRNDDRVHLELYPKVEYQEGYLLNAIEICPFNAIFDEKSLKFPPSWKLQRFDSISTESSVGNNISVFVQDNEIAYIKPRKNPNVNIYIPDIVRDLHRHNESDRLDVMTLHGQKVEERKLMLFLLSKIGFGHRCAMICNGSLSLESMMLVRQLADVLGAKTFVRRHRQSGDDWLISKDKNTNLRGALLTQVIKKGTIDDFSEIESLVAHRQIQTLIVFGEDILSLGYAKENFAAVDSITFSSHRNETTQHSHVILPICTHFEEDGHFINKDFLLQRFHRSLIRKTEAKPLWEWLAMIKNIYTGQGKDDAEFQSIEHIWTFMEKVIPEFEDVKFSTLPATGTILKFRRQETYDFL